MDEFKHSYKDLRKLVKILRGIKKFSLALLRAVKYRFVWGSSSPNPYDLIFVNPSDINYILINTNELIPDNYGIYIVGGEWDQQISDEGLILANKLEGKYDAPTLIPISEYEFFKSSKKHFLDNVPWEDTKLYRWIKNNRKCVNNWGKGDYVTRKLIGFDDLFDRIADQGYTQQRKLIGDQDDPRGASRFPIPEHHEITVAIGRDGKIFLIDGRHRFVAARILGLDQIPVRVLIRHRKLQRNESKT